MFDAESSAASVTLDAAPDATPGTLTAVVAGAVPVNVEVAPAVLPMEIVPRRFRLSLSVAPADPARRIAREARPHAFIPDLDFAPLVSIITVTEEGEDITIESLVVGVAISHPDRSELEVVLTPPGGTTVTLHRPNALLTLGPTSSGHICRWATRVWRPWSGVARRAIGR